MDKDSYISTGGFGGGMRNSTTMYNSTIKLITINVAFGGYLTQSELLDYKILYLPNGFQGTTFQNITEVSGVVQELKEVPYNKEDKKPPSINLVISTKNFTPNDKSMFLVLCRANINNSQFFPIPRNNEERYLATAFPHIRTSYQAGLYFTDGVSDTVIAGTEKELVNLKKWKK